MFLKKLFWFYLFLNPLLDIANGVYIRLVGEIGVLDVETISTLGVTPSLLIRLLFLLLFALFLVLSRDRLGVAALAAVALAWVLSLLSEYLRCGRVAFFVDAQYIARFCYNLAVLLVFSRVFADRWGYDGKDLLASLGTVIHYTLIVLSLAVLIPAILGLGYSTYADLLGYRGNRGYFYAGNDITAILTVLLPLSIAGEMTRAADAKAASGRTRPAVLPALAAALAANALMIIGSKTAFLALILSFSVMFFVAVLSPRKRRTPGAFRGYLCVLLATLAVCLAVNLIAVLQHLGEIRRTYGGITWQGIYDCSIFSTVAGSVSATEELLGEEIGLSLFNGRLIKLRAQCSEFFAGGLLTWLFGLGRGSQSIVVEMDLFEVLFYYGVFGLAAMLWLYVRLAVDFLRGFFRQPGIRAVALFLSLGMTAGYLVIAGHILFSVTSGFYFSSRVLFARTPEDILIRRRR
jgi:hypothetical protein